MGHSNPGDRVARSDERRNIVQARQCASEIGQAEAHGTTLPVATVRPNVAARFGAESRVSGRDSKPARSVYSRSA